jgi:hypothetical protein
MYISNTKKHHVVNANIQADTCFVEITWQIEKREAPHKLFLSYHHQTVLEELKEKEKFRSRKQIMLSLHT